MQRKTRRWLTPCVEYGIEPDAETVQTYRTINEELWRQLEKGQIRRDKLMGERFTRFLKASECCRQRRGDEQILSGSALYPP